MKKGNKSIYDKLGHLKAPINKEQSWQDLYQRDGFPRKEKKRRIILWFFCGLTALAIGNTLIFIINTNSSLPIEHKTTPVKSSKESKPTASITIQNPDLSKEGITSDASKKSMSLPKSIEIDRSSGLEIITSNAIVDLPIDALPSLTSTPSTSKKGIEKQSSLTEILNQKLSSDQQESTPKISINSVAKNPQKQELASVIADRENRTKPVPSIFFRNPFPLERPALLLPIKNNTEDMLSIAPSPKRWALEFGLGIGDSNQSIQTDELSEGQAFQNNNTRSLVSYMTDLRLSKELRYNLRLSIGVRYANHRSVFSFAGNNTQYIRQPDSTPFKYFESTTTGAYTLYHNRHNLAIETALNKDFNWNKTTVYLGVGVGFNVLSNFTGQGINARLEAVDLTTIGDFKDNLGFHLLYEVGIMRWFNNDFFISTSIAGKSRQNLDTNKRQYIRPLYWRVGVGKRF